VKVYSGKLVTTRLINLSFVNQLVIVRTIQPLRSRVSTENHGLKTNSSMEVAEEGDIATGIGSAISDLFPRTCTQLPES
jgi:hypothetical protein